MPRRAASPGLHALLAARARAHLPRRPPRAHGALVEDRHATRPVPVSAAERAPGARRQPRAAECVPRRARCRRPHRGARLVRHVAVALRLRQRAAPAAPRHRAAPERRRPVHRLGAQDGRGGARRRSVTRSCCPTARLWPDSVLQYRPSTGDDRLGVARLGPPRAGPRSDQGQLRRREPAPREDRRQPRARGQRPATRTGTTSTVSTTTPSATRSCSARDRSASSGSSTTAPPPSEARGPAGDLLFRYGNPGDHRSSAPRTLFVQHDAEWIPAVCPAPARSSCSATGCRRPAPTRRSRRSRLGSTNGEYVRNGDGTFAADRERVFPKRGDERFFAAIISGAQRLPNGDTLIVDGPHGRLLEVDPKGATVWEYENPHYTVRANTPKASGAGEPIDPWWTFRALRYPRRRSRGRAPGGHLSRSRRRS